MSKTAQFWEEQSKGGPKGLFGAHSDPFITDLESWYIINFALKPHPPRTLLDVGCGNGERTELLSRYVRHLTVGVDYSEGMVRLAKKRETKRLVFKQVDLLRDDLEVKPDMVVSCRCLINMSDHRQVLRVLDSLYRTLPAGGWLVLCEVSKQGHERVNALRASLGLGRLKMPWHNINLDEHMVLRKMHGKFEFTNLTRFGLYYTMTRVLHSKLVYPNEPNPKADINRIACDIQKRVGIGQAEEYGRQFCVVGRKLG